LLKWFNSLFETPKIEDCIAEFCEELGCKADLTGSSDTLVEVVLEDGVLYNWDWCEVPYAVAEGIDALLLRRKMPPLSSEEREHIVTIDEGERGDSMPIALAEGDTVMLARGQRLLALDTNSDQYCAAVVPKEFYERWVNVRLAEGLCTRDHHKGGGEPPKETKPRELQ
jgi:hypothetical protein